MAKKSLQKKVALLNEYITREIEKEMSNEITQMERDNTAKIEKKYIVTGKHVLFTSCLW